MLLERVANGKRAAARLASPPRLLDISIPWASLNQHELRHAPCNVCGTFDFRPIASLVMNSTESFLVECPTCELIWRNPLPGAGFLDQLYGPEYYAVSDKYPQLAGQVGIADTASTDREFRDNISARVVESWVELGIRPTGLGGASKRMLELGGGRGYLQRAAAARGWTTIGAELSEHAVEEARKNGLTMFHLPPNELPFQSIAREEPFDLIVFYDFLEHVLDPAATLRSVKSLLADGGAVAFRVPNSQGCPTLHLVDHIWHFSTSSLYTVLRKERLAVWHAHHSGRFSGTAGKHIDNMTVFVRKATAESSVEFPPIELGPNPLGL